MNYVKQVNPMYQESPLWMFNNSKNGTIENHDEYNGLILIPSDRCIGINNEDMTNLISVVNNIMETYENIKNGGYDNYYKNMTECIKFETGSKPSTKAVHEWKELVKDFDELDDNCLCAALCLYNSENWDYMSIHGCCQGDYAVVFYNTALWDKKGIEALEAEYFNTVSEWIVHDENYTPECAEDISGYSMYITNWDIEKELKAELGEDVIIYEWDGINYSNKYKKIS